MDLSRQRELARHLATLRREARQQSGLDEGLVPPDADTAYRIAEMVEEELGWAVVGWKIAGMKPGLQRQLRTTSPIYGRVFAPLIQSRMVRYCGESFSQRTPPPCDICPDGFATIRLNSGAPGRTRLMLASKPSQPPPPR